MLCSFQKVFSPTDDLIKKRNKTANAILRLNLKRCGKDCSNCKHCVYVQQSPYYDYLTCKFDNTVELPGGLDKRHCCDKYEFVGFAEE